MIPNTLLVTLLHMHCKLLTLLHSSLVYSVHNIIVVDYNISCIQVSLLTHVASSYLNAGVEAERLGTAHASIVPYQVSIHYSLTEGIFYL